VAKPICCVTKCASRDRQGQRAAGWIFLLTMPFAAKELHIFISERLGLRFAKPLPFRARARTNHDTWSPRIDLAVAAVLGVLVWHLASAGNQRLRRYFETSDRRRPRGTRALRRSASHFAPRYYSAVGKASSPRSSGRRQ
jgi:hypothetical protein